MHLSCWAFRIVSATDISIEPPSAVGPAGRPRALVKQTVERSLLVLIYLMTWSNPISSRLAINVFRVAAILWLLLAWQRDRTRPGSRIFFPWICFFAVAAIASIVSDDPHTSWQQMKVVEMGFAAVLIADTLRSLRALKIRSMPRGWLGVRIFPNASATRATAAAFF